MPGSWYAPEATEIKPTNDINNSLGAIGPVGSNHRVRRQLADHSPCVDIRRE